ncbi:cell division protein CrgA [Kineococcus sp. SYSU DK018]|uniref:cell division protein CrgA n=1 Tax=Kineococcus sp. SYSU DK018 TaxID=3383139 RepID=UPI003D7DE300
MPKSRHERDRDEEGAAEGTGATAAGAEQPAGDAAAETPKRRRRRRRGGEGDETDRAIKARNRLTPRWWVAVMVALMVLGLLWIVVFYLSSAQYPVPGWGNWNLVAGFGLVLVGFAMTTRWR